MNEATTDVIRRLALLVLSCALPACWTTEEPLAWDDEPIDVMIEPLGTVVPGCASGFSNGTLTLSAGADPLLLNAQGGAFRVNGHICRGTILNVEQALTTKNVAKIVINGDANANKVVLDLLPGTLGPKVLSNAGGVLVDFATTSGGADSFLVRGSTAADTFKFAKVTTNSDVLVELSRDKVADVRVKPGASLAFTAAMGGGNDVVSAKPLSTDILSYMNSAVSIAPLENGITVYGGAGDDQFTGGVGNDVFFGGAGNDTFKAVGYPDGNDVFSGDADTDTADYAARSGALAIDIGPTRVSRTARADLGKLSYAALAGTTLVFSIDGAADTTVMFATPSDPDDLIAEINAEAGASVASIGGKNQLVISSLTNTVSSSVEIKNSTAIAANLLDMPAGIATTVAGTDIPADADDGEAGETDDIRSGVENITGGSGNDVLIGDAGKNTIKGGGGNDHIAGGANSCAPELTAANGDALQGEAGDDTFYVPVANCWALLTGGAGANAADFSARTASVSLSNNGVATDGINTERVNIMSDVQKLIGGFGDDTLVGGMNNETFVGGAGADVMNGGSGTADTVDYSAVSVATTVTACFTSTIDMCGAGNDGPGEGDQVFLIERVIGGSGIDTFSVVNDAAVSVTFDGRAGADHLTGGAGDDTLIGGDDNDTVLGGDGEDTINGGPGVDVIDGGDGDGDLCTFDALDSPVAVGCEG